MRTHSSTAGHLISWHSVTIIMFEKTNSVLDFQPLLGVFIVAAGSTRFPYSWEEKTEMDIDPTIHLRVHCQWHRDLPLLKDATVYKDH